MSSLSETIAVPLPHEAKRAKRAGPVQEYFRKTGWLYLARCMLRLMAYGSLLMMVGSFIFAPAIFQSKVFLLAMNTHPLVLASTAHSMPIWLFFGIAVVRRMVPMPLNYMIGVRSIYLIEASFKKYGKYRLVRGMKRMMGWPTWAKSLAIVGLTIYSLPLPPLSPNVYTFAGASRMKFLWVVAADLAGTLVVVGGCYLLGSVFNPLAAIQRYF